MSVFTAVALVAPRIVPLHPILTSRSVTRKVATSRFKPLLIASGLTVALSALLLTGCAPDNPNATLGQPRETPKPSTPDAPPNALYVATNGDDTNAGTLEKPFKTVQKCAGTAKAGVTCIVRAGTYRETVTPANSGTSAAPITFRPYNGETVLISGADPVTGWTVERGNTFKAPIAWDLGEGNNQVFVSGAMISEAQYPNVPITNGRADRFAAWPGRFIKPVGGGTRWTINAENVPANLTGAKINFLPGPNWIVETGTVTASTSSGISLDSPKGQMTEAPEFDANLYKPREGNPYFVWGKLELLDSPGEWFHDTKTLHVWMPNGADPTGQTVEVKRRAYAFDLTGCSHIVVRGFQIFASSLTTANPDTKDKLGTGHDIVLDGLGVRYVSHFTAVVPTQGWGDSWSIGATTTGLILDGQNITLQNSSIVHSAGNGVSMSDRAITVKNNIISDVDYSAANGSGIVAQWGLEASEISDNTVFNVGRTVINHGGAKGLKILRNHLYNNGLLTEDVGLTGSFQNDGAGTEIAYNLVHDNFSEGVSVGIYLDNGSKNYVVHHNVVYNVGTALDLNLPTIGNQVYNNTLVGWSEAVSSWGPNRNPETLDVSGTKLSKNIFVGRRNISASGGDGPLNLSIAAENNIETDQNPMFVNPTENDFRLQRGSPAAGLGALEGNPLKVGANFAQPCVYGDDCTPRVERSYGLLGQYYSDEALKTLSWTRIDPRLDFGWWDDTKSPPGTYMPSGQNFSARWTGFLEAPVSGTYTFIVTADDGSRLWVNNQLISDHWTYDNGFEHQGTISLQAGQRVPVKMEMHQITGGASAKLEWIFAGQARQVVPRRWLSSR